MFGKVDPRKPKLAIRTTPMWHKSKYEREEEEEEMTLELFSFKSGQE